MGMGKWVSFGKRWEQTTDVLIPRVYLHGYMTDAAVKSLQQKKNVLTAGRYQTFCGESDPLLQSLLPVSFQAREMLCLQGPCREGMGCSGVQKRWRCGDCWKICTSGCADGRAQFSFLKEKMVFRLFC